MIDRLRTVEASVLPGVGQHREDLFRRCLDDSLDADGVSFHPPTLARFAGSEIGQYRRYLGAVAARIPGMLPVLTSRRCCCRVWVCGTNSPVRRVNGSASSP